MYSSCCYIDLLVLLDEPRSLGPTRLLSITLTMYIVLYPAFTDVKQASVTISWQSALMHTV